MKLRWPWSKRASLENPTTPINNPDIWLQEALGGGASLSGEWVNADAAIGESAAGKCIRVLAEDISILPLNLYFDDGDARELARNHPLYRVLRHQANDYQTAAEWRLMTQYHLGGWGAAYSFIERDDRNIPTALLPLEPDRTWAERKNGALRFVTQMNDGTNIELPPERVLWLKWFSFDGITPLSPIGVNRERIGRQVATGRFGSRFFGRGGQLKGVITTPNKVADPKRLRENWESVYGGSANAWRTAVLEEGMEYKSVGVNPKDSQFIEAMGYQESDIASIYRIPEMFLNRNDRATWNNARAFLSYYLKHVLQAWLVRYEQRMVMQLLGRSAQTSMSIEFDKSEYLRGDPLEESQRDAAYLTNGVITRNEVRRKLGHNPLPGLDVPLDPVAQAQVPDDEPDEEPAADEDEPSGRQLAEAAVERVCRATIKQKDDSKMDRHAVWISRVLNIDLYSATDFLDHCVRDERGTVVVKPSGREHLMKVLGYEG